MGWDRRGESVGCMIWYGTTEGMGDSGTELHCIGVVGYIMVEEYYESIICRAATQPLCGA